MKAEVWYYRDMDILVIKHGYMGMVYLTSDLGEGVYCRDEWRIKGLIYIGEL